ncbi:Aldehyde dehydrogenase family protein [Epibacterium ulvae]|uniref:Aldehyde dehydrogenase family protein n=1 Tax=Epibacterium ulvae TaxID=1156985 RepID=A0A1G5QL85_9RHOB|nr:Aldehyde dehydrogenase family protein [Epibacterium ulvae]
MFSGDISDNGVAGGAYVAPALVKMPGQTAPIETETFAPILYVIEYETLEDAIGLQNEVPQGLSSCIFTLDILKAETFLSSLGSDCGIANVNMAHPVPKLVVHLAERRKLEAGANVALMHGKAACAARLAPCIIRLSCPLRRVSNSTSELLARLTRRASTHYRRTI